MCYMGHRARLVGVRELRQNLSVHLDRVKEGQTLTVTEHGHAVAELRPLPRMEDPIARLQASGQIIPARRPVSTLPRPVALNLETPLSALLDELREDTV